ASRVGVAAICRLRGGKGANMRLKLPVRLAALAGAQSRPYSVFSRVSGARPPGGAHVRDKLLKVLLALVGLGVLAANYLLVAALANPGHAPVSTGDQMILGIYLPLGVFLLLAIRDPQANRSLILAFGWSTITHGAVMT